MKMAEKFISFIKSKQHSLVNLLIHLSAVSLFVLPEVITNIDDQRPVPNGIIIKTIIYLVIFYINYFLIDRFLDKKGGKWHFVGMNIVLLVVASGIILTTSHGYTDKDFHPIKRPPHHEKTLPPPKYETPDGKPFEHVHPPRHEHKNIYLHAAGRLSRDLLIAILSIGLAFAVRVTARWLETQRKQAALMASQRETELENLKSQINPHFLFNTLNTIYALIAVKPEQAQKAIHELSGMMRYALYDTSEMVTLKQEIDFLNHFISLMRMRMNEKRPIEASLSCNHYCDYKVAPLIFIPIIENVFKYGNTGNTSLPIKIDISVNDGIVRCYTFNHFDKNNHIDKKDSGIGFANLKRRLKIIYGKDASFSVIQQDDTFQVELTINLNNSKYNQNDNS